MTSFLPVVTAEITHLNASYLKSAMESNDGIILLTPSSCYSLCAWSNASFYQRFGWSCDAILGSEIFFLHGDAANWIPFAKKLRELESSLQGFQCSHNCYTHDGVLLQCTVIVNAIMEPSSKHYSIAFVEVKFMDVQEISFPAALFPRTFEIGMPLDRRDYCKSYSNYYGPAVAKNNISSVSHFDKFCKQVSMTNIVSLMMATTSLIMLCNSEGNIVAASAKCSSTFSNVSHQVNEHTNDHIIGRSVESWLGRNRFSESEMIKSKFLTAMAFLYPNSRSRISNDGRSSTPLASSPAARMECLSRPDVVVKTSSERADFSAYASSFSHGLYRVAQPTDISLSLHTADHEISILEDTSTLRLHCRSPVAKGNAPAGWDVLLANDGPASCNTSPITVAYIRASPVLVPGFNCSRHQTGTFSKLTEPKVSCQVDGGQQQTSLPDMSRMAFDFISWGAKEDANVESITTPSNSFTLGNKKRRMSVEFFKEFTGVSASIGALTTSCIDAFKSFSERIVDKSVVGSLSAPAIIEESSTRKKYSDRRIPESDLESVRTELFADHPRAEQTSGNGNAGEKPTYESQHHVVAPLAHEQAVIHEDSKSASVMTFKAINTFRVTDSGDIDHKRYTEVGIPQIPATSRPVPNIHGTLPCNLDGSCLDFEAILPVNNTCNSAKFQVSIRPLQISSPEESSRLMCVLLIPIR